MDPKTRELLKSRQKLEVIRNPDLQQLIDILETKIENSVFVAHPGGEPDALIISKRGEFVSLNENYVIESCFSQEEGMKYHGCHLNSAMKWYKNYKKDNNNKLNLKIMIGYYFVDYNHPVWRQHTWLIDDNNKKIYDTTLEKFKEPTDLNNLVYFGVKLSTKEALVFCQREGVQCLI